jgi:cytoskeleton protein RodZ
MILARAREAAGLSIDDVAMQLKLAPRQVVAIERDDFAGLPGRTFIRGFTRNYARLLKLDADAVLEALPGEHGTAPERAPLATSRAMGEMPTERPPRANIARWAIPLVLVAIVAVAAFYEFARPQGSRAPVPPTPIAPAPATAPVPLVNPVRPASDAATSAPATTLAPATTEAAPPVSLAPAPAAATTEPTAVVTPVTASSAPASQDAAAATTATRGNQLALRFRGTSWVEVRDRSGSVVLSMTGSDGATRELLVSPPGEVVVGNAGAIDATWRGRPIDVMAQSRQNVARIKLD